MSRDDTARRWSLEDRIRLLEERQQRRETRTREQVEALTARLALTETALDIAQREAAALRRDQAQLWFEVEQLKQQQASRRTA